MTNTQRTAPFRKFAVLLLALLLVLSLAACKAEEPAATEESAIYSVTRNEGIYTIDTGNCTISLGNYTYKYEFQGDTSAYVVTFLYPNGQSGTWKQNNGSGIGIGYTGGFGTLYADSSQLAEVLVKVLVQQDPSLNAQKGIGGSPLFLLIILIGIVHLAFPEAMIRFEVTLWIKNAEPSDFAISATRALGIFAILFGVIGLLL